jgi:FAD/FMN-containing dehydrogenase
MRATQAIDATAVGKLGDGFRGQLVRPSDAGYDQARAVWNAITDRHPALIARCTCVEDVLAAVRFAREHRLVIAVRGGGHSVAGFSTCDDGLVIDLAGMRIDNLLSVALVTADGALRHVTEESDPELFFGIRGAGANFGIATGFEFRLHPIGPKVTTAVVVFPIERAREAAALYRELSRSAPDHMHLGLNFATAPGGRASTASARGNATVAVGVAHFGDPKDVDRDLRALRGHVDPIAETVAQTTYLALQRMSDDEMAWGKRFYMKGAFFDDLPDAAVDLAAAHVSRAPGECSIGLWAQGGATANVAEEATAFAGRGAAHWVGAEVFWTDKERDADHITWGRAAMAALKPYTAAGNYVNDIVEQGDDVVRAIYGDAKYERLRALKRKLDPENVFRLNQNIRP